MRFEAVVDKLPADFETTRAEARAERYAFLERLANDWASGAMLFDRPGEALLAAYSEGVLAAIGGITIDPIVPDALRMRALPHDLAHFVVEHPKIGSRILGIEAHSPPLLTLGCASHDS